MKSVVTGAGGFVGRGLLEWLAARGHQGMATGRAAPARLPAGWTAATRGDLLAAEAGSVADRAGIDAVIHLEVKQHVPRPTAADLDEFTAVNVGGTREWLDWAERMGVKRFVLVSTIKAVAAGAGPHPESAPLETRAGYGRSKAEAERLVSAWAAADPARAAVILRPAPVYGPGNEANLAAFVRQVLAGRPCLIGSGDTRKSIVSRTNLGAAIEFAATTAHPGCEVYNVSDLETPSLAELATLIADLAGADRPKRIPALLAAVVAPVGDVVTQLTGRDFPLTTSRLRAIHETTIFPCDKLVKAGFVHPQSTREGIAEMLAWVRAGSG
jgi:nucleoside-diphosphate-sugar epimerase